MTRNRNPQPEGLPEISRGSSGSASDTPGQGVENEKHPEGVRERFGFFQRLWHPFRVRNSICRATGGIAALNPRLISCTPSAWLLLLALLFPFAARAQSIAVIIETN